MLSYGVVPYTTLLNALSGRMVSFGIYLVHVFFLMLLRNFGITALSFPPVLSVPVLTAAVFLASLAAAWLLSKVPFVGKYLT